MKTINCKRFKQFLKDRREVLLSLDIKKAKAYCRKYKLPIPKNEIVLLAGLHKARCEITDIPKKEKDISRKWLIERKMYPGLGIEKDRNND